MILPGLLYYSHQMMCTLLPHIFPCMRNHNRRVERDKSIPFLRRIRQFCLLFIELRTLADCTAGKQQYSSKKHRKYSKYRLHSVTLHLAMTYS